MKIGRKPLIWSAAIVVVVAIVVAVIANRPRTRPLSLGGAVMRQDADPRKELPLADVQVSALSNGSVIGTGKSDASGFYTIVLRTRLWIGRPVLLQFRHADYQPLDQKDFIGDKVYVAKMMPIPHETNTAKRPDVVVSNIQVRYSIKTTTTANVGSAVTVLRGSEYRQCALRKEAAMFARRKMESCDRLEDTGRRREQRIPQFANLMHCGPLSLYQDR